MRGKAGPVRTRFTGLRKLFEPAEKGEAVERVKKQIIFWDEAGIFERPFSGPVLDGVYDGTADPVGG